MKTVWILALASMLTSCSSIMSSATHNMAGQLSRAVMASDDIKTVRDGVPAYMLLLDGMVEDEPQNQSLLLSAAKLYSAYASIFVTDPLRQQKMAKRAFRYASQAACLQDKDFCDLPLQPFEKFASLIKRSKTGQTELLFNLGTSWAAHIQASSDDWKVVANLPKVQLMMEQILVLDENYQNGDAHYYLGIMYSLIPPALGGKPQVALRHFERAMALSKQQNLMIQVAIAERYARVVFDRPLHDQLLNDVLANDLDAAPYRLMNTLAKEKARALLASGDDFF